jgi:hypothetical protein
VIHAALSVPNGRRYPQRSPLSPTVAVIPNGRMAALRRIKFGKYNGKFDIKIDG